MKKRWKVSLIILTVLIVFFEIFSIIALLKEKSKIEKEINLKKSENIKKKNEIEKVESEIIRLKKEQEDLNRIKEGAKNEK